MPKVGIAKQTRSPDAELSGFSVTRSGDDLRARLTQGQGVRDTGISCSRAINDTLMVLKMRKGTEVCTKSSGHAKHAKELEMHYTGPCRGLHRESCMPRLLS